MRTVAQAYDQLAPRFGEWSANVVGDPWEQFVDQLESLLPKHAPVLDPGCGSGAKTKRLTRSFEVIAVDVSTEQLRLAREEAPDATFLQADFAELERGNELPTGPFGGLRGARRRRALHARARAW